ncbi:GNAT family N-acetyltransferase [Motilimonas sp. KMU-193]|uniref:GNAT family N-acetyltransferase n=1 Tax=Motilimonas sp. KMU-193 TaxID=3388668 RepID=UPI00396B380E
MLDTVSSDVHRDNTKRFREHGYDAALYQEYFPLANKTLWTRLVNIDDDLDIIHHWMNQPHVTEFWHMAWPKADIRDYLRRCDAREGFQTYLMFMDQEPLGYFEIYQPSLDVVGTTYEVETGDIGLHVLIGEEKYQRRYIMRLGTMMMRIVFSQYPQAIRAIGEPDVNNKTVQSVMKFLGFQFMKNIQLPDKTAALHYCLKSDFIRSHCSIA